MYRQGSHSPVPPVPPIPASMAPTRSFSQSTTASTKSSAGGSGGAGGLGSPRVPIRRKTSASTTTTTTGKDDLDKLGYLFSLRVALLHHHLARPPPPRSSGISLNSPSASSPGLGSPHSFLSSPPPTLRTPDPQQPSSGQTTPTTPGRRKSFGLSLRKADPDVCKLPKEFLIEFWNTLAEENGDQAWHATVSSLLGTVTKGTKTGSGMNLREIPTLLDAFSSCVPPSSPAHIHQSHFLNLLYNSLPRSSWFSPLARTQTDKDKDLLFRLRAEVQTYMLPVSPDPGARSPEMGGLGPRRISANEVKRKPSPIWVEDGHGEMVEAVGLVWDIESRTVERDAASLKRSGSLELSYLTDLKRQMSALSMTGQSTLPPSQRSRQIALHQALQSLLRDFPELAMPSSPVDFSFSSSAELYFTPPSKGQVFARLTSRATEAGNTPQAKDLIERCREIWGIESRRGKERELEALVPRWGNSIGTREEVELGHLIVEAVSDIAPHIGPNEDLPPIITKLHGDLMALLADSISSIFPTSSVPPPPPNPSVLPILRAAPELLDRPPANKALQDLTDEVKGQAVSEYVMAMSHYGMGGMGEPNGNGRVNESGKDAQVAAFEEIAEWMDKAVSTVRKVWRDGLGPALNPAGIILSKQLPLFLAELPGLDRPRVAASDVFPLYESTGRLLSHWEDLCPGQEHGFELDAFFQPHVEAWLRDAEDNNVHDWVSRAVGMDSWVPEGENKHSQSVIDLFEFLRAAAQVILHDLPLGEYKRAVYLTDLSKTCSIAVSQYASTVQALFMADMTPKSSTPTQEIHNRLDKMGGMGGKAGNWLAKGQQAVRSLEKKKTQEGFMVPPAACVKLTDMGAAQVSLDDLNFAMEAEECARIIKPKMNAVAARSVFNITVMRGENMSGKGNKAPDAFVVVVDKDNGERLLKSRTILGAEDPRWEQSFETSVGTFKTLELSAYDRQLVGKHDLIGTSTFKLDPRLYTTLPSRDIVIPLGRGMVHLRVTMAGGEKNDVAYHLSVANRALERAADDMTREIVERMAEFVKSQLSLTTLGALTRPLKDKKAKKTVLTPEDIETSLAPLFDYLNDNFSTFSVTLTAPSRLKVMLLLWRRTIDILISLLVPPLSDRPSNREPLSGPETDVVFKWLQLLKAFFNASEHGTEHGVPLVQLQAGAYKDIITLGQYIDLPTPALKEKCQAAVKSAARPGGMNRGLSQGMAGMSLADGAAEDSERMAEVLLRIARTRDGMAEFLQVQVSSLTRSRVERQTAAM